ncbi:MAG: cation diffusion facilitator family transporter [Gemmatimonadales bacterium]
MSRTPAASRGRPSGRSGGHPHDHAHGHTHGHAHAHGSHAGGGSRAVSTRLLWVLGITAVFMLAEAIGGVVSGSLALLADAGHMLTDVAALGLSVFAMRLARRPASTKRTFGYARLEILAALINGAGLLVIAGLIIVEAWQRFTAPGEVRGGLMLGVAALGLGVNVVGATLLHDHAHDNLNVRGAYLHVLGDLLGSVGAIAAAVVILTTGWTPIDPLVSIVIALLILWSAWGLVRESADILLESAPRHLDMDAIVSDLAGIEGLHDVHDVHVWTVTSGFVALSAHGVIDDPRHHGRVLDEVRRRMEVHGIGHVTFQIEPRPLYQLPSAPAR